MYFDLGNNYSIRTFLYGDVISLHTYGKNPKIHRYMRNNFAYRISIEETRKWIDYVKKNLANSHLVIAYKSKAIGSISLTKHSDVHRYSAEVGYWLAYEHWGKGIISKALKFIIDYGFSRLNIVRLFAEVNEHNTVSCHILEKCGFELESTMQKHIYKDSFLFDQLMYIKINPNYLDCDFS